MRYRTTQKEFLRVAEEQCVRYDHPAMFRAGETVLTVRPGSVPRFLSRLSTVMSFADYERLTREVYVAHLRAARNPSGAAPG